MRFSPSTPARLFAVLATLALGATFLVPLRMLAQATAPARAKSSASPRASSSSTPPPPAAAPAPAEPEEIKPTTTVATGDRGGLLFGQKPDPSRVRHYYIAAEHELWDYAPAGRDEVCGLPLPPTLLAQRAVGKTRYVQYTDATFGARAFGTPSLGVLGPVLRGVVGDYLVVTFLNRTDQPLSLHPHGVKYDKDSEGSYYQPAPGFGAAVGPGATFTYVWFLDESSGPLPTEPSSRGWLYHSHVAGDQETNLGLIGSIIVTDPKRARVDGTPADVDREFATLFMIFDESGLDAAATEAAEYANLPGAAPAALSWAEVQQAIEQNSRYGINGRVFGNLSGLEMNEGERVRWYLYALGSEQDFHTAHWHGLRVIEEGRRRTDVVELLPASMKVADLLADNPGTWLFHCHVAEHMKEGMFSKLVVHAKDTVGVDRSPAFAFLGQPAALHSMRLTRAELRRASAPAASSSANSSAAAREFHVEGIATAFEGLAIFNQTFRLRLGEKTVALQPNAAGDATAPGVRFRVKNATEFGVINGGQLEFEATLSGPDWTPEFDKLSARPPAPTLPATPGKSATPTPPSLGLDFGRAHHLAPVVLTTR